MIEILQDPAWLSIGVFVTLLLITITSGLGWYIHGRKQRREVDSKFSAHTPPISSVKRVPRRSMEEQAQQLLIAFYELAEGSPGQWVAGAEAAERAGIPFTTQDYDPLFRYLRQWGLITTDNLVHNEVCKLTPEGIRVVEHVVSSTAPPDSMESPKS